jgi:hypothetical protein
MKLRDPRRRLVCMNIRQHRNAGATFERATQKRRGKIVHRNIEVRGRTRIGLVANRVRDAVTHGIWIARKEQPGAVRRENMPNFCQQLRDGRVEVFVSREHTGDTVHVLLHAALLSGFDASRDVLSQPHDTHHAIALFLRKKLQLQVINTRAV